VVAGAASAGSSCKLKSPEPNRVGSESCEAILESSALGSLAPASPGTETLVGSDESAAPGSDAAVGSSAAGTGAPKRTSASSAFFFHSWRRKRCTATVYHSTACSRLPECS
jgi:hypothetical protein